MDTQTEWILKSAIEASAARADATATMLTKQIDQIGIMVSKLVNLPYNPIVEQKAAETATEEATATALQERTVLPASSHTAPAPLTDTSNLSQSSTTTGSKSATSGPQCQILTVVRELQRIIQRMLLSRLPPPLLIQSATRSKNSHFGPHKYHPRTCDSHHANKENRPDRHYGL